MSRPWSGWSYLGGWMDKLHSYNHNDRLGVTVRGGGGLPYFNAQVSPSGGFAGWTPWMQ